MNRATTREKPLEKKQHIVIIGGGAAGLELIARLSRKNKGKFMLTLVDNKLKHIWKPLLHEIAAGTLAEDALDYIAFAHDNHFDFHLGNILSINRKNKTVTLAAFNEINYGMILPERILPYDVLVLAIGSLTNDFNIPGVKKYCLMLDNLNQAERFNQVLLNKIISYSEPQVSVMPPTAAIPSRAVTAEETSSIKPHKLKIAIVGAGATGVELAAEIQAMLSKVSQFLNRTYQDWIELTIIEAAPHILSNLPIRLSNVVEKFLNKNNIRIIKNYPIAEVLADGVKGKDGQFIESTITVWAAGVKGDACLQALDNLPVNSINQLKVNTYLQTADSDIFALGDCASCEWLGHSGKWIPARAQAAHQQAALLAKSIPDYLKNRPLKPFQYQDYGSLISLTHSYVFGTIMLRTAKSLFLEGLFARWAYWFLYKKHLYVLKGFKFTVLHSLSNWLLGKQKVRIKLH